MSSARHRAQSDTNREELLAELQPVSFITEMFYDLHVCAVCADPAEILFFFFLQAETKLICCYFASPSILSITKWLGRVSTARAARRQLHPETEGCFFVAPQLIRERRKGDAFQKR